MLKYVGKAGDAVQACLQYQSGNGYTLPVNCGKLISISVGSGVSLHVRHFIIFIIITIIIIIWHLLQ